MSFFDEDDEPTRRQPRPRRAAPAGGGHPADHQTLLVRRAIAIGGGLLILLLLVFAVDSCRDSSRKNALKDYNRELGSLVAESDTQVGAPFFELLAQGGGESPQDLQTQISGYRVQAETLLDQAEGLDVPDDMAAAQRSALIALELRRDGLDFIAQRVSSALGDEGDAADEAVEQIAGQMQAFLASDVLFESRVTPLVKKTLDDAEVGGQRVLATRGFLPDIDWLRPATVAERLGTQLSEGGQNRDPDDPPAPGLHGTGLVSVAIGETTLQPGTANRIAVGDEPPTVTVTFANQGENDEFDVRVVARLDGAGEPQRIARTIDTVAQGAEAEANLQFESAPTTGEALTLSVEVRPVPGEEKTDNNEQTYPVLFTAQ